MLRHVHGIERLVVAIASTVAATGLSGIGAHTDAMEKIGGIADLLAGAICVYKVWRGRKRGAFR